MAQGTRHVRPVAPGPAHGNVARGDAVKDNLVRVGVDLDGVLHDYCHGFAVFLNSIGHPQAPDLDTLDSLNVAYAFYEAWGITKDEYLALHNYPGYGRVYTGPAISIGGPAAIRGLWAAGHEVHVITARTHPDAAFWTRQWLGEHRIPVTSLTLDGDKAAHAHKIDVMVEDSIDQYDALTRAGVDCWLIDRRWNHQEGCTRKRLLDVTLFAATVKGMERVPRSPVPVKGPTSPMLSNADGHLDDGDDTPREPIGASA
jgi:uncharacterized HAD superfamily protein